MLTLCAAAAPLWWGYLHPAIIVAVVGGALTGTVLGMVGARTGASATVVCVWALVLYPVAGMALAAPTARAELFPVTADTAGAFWTIITGTITSWKELLTAVPPFGDYETLLLPPFIVLLCCSLVGASVLLRSRHPMGGYAAPFAVLVFATVFGPTAVDVGPAALAGVAVIVLVTGRIALAGGVWRGAVGRLGAATAVIVVCGGIGLGSVTAASPALDRQVLRQAFTPPIDLSAQTSPLTGFRAAVTLPDSERRVLSADGLPDGARIRLAVLDDYTGLVFRLAAAEGPTAPSDALSAASSNGGFQRVPSEIVRAGASDQHRVDVTLRVEPTSDIWLPSVGDLTRLTFEAPISGAPVDRFVYDRTRSVGALLGGFPERTSYRVEAVIGQEPDLGAVARLSPGRAHQPDVVNLPEDLVSAAATVREPSSAPGEQLAAVLGWLRSGYVSHGGPGEPPSRPGHSVDRLNLLATAKPMIGDAEQYAAALALLAREIGFPSRVVVGYLPHDARSTGTDAGSIAVVGADTTAWTEVQDADGRWLVLDPNPEPRPVPQIDRSVEDPAAHPRTVLPPEPPERAEHIDEQQDENEAKDEPDRSSWLTVVLGVLRVVGIVVLVVGIALSPVIVTMTTAAIRRRRRRRADHDQGRLVGLWDEARDGLIARGFSVHRTDTRSELAESSGSAAVRVLAVDVDRSVFADGDGPTTTDIDTSWAALPRLFTEIDQDRSRWQRVVSRSVPRALVWWFTNALAADRRRPGRVDDDQDGGTV